MIIINEKDKCCGCAACLQRCPKNCISLVNDNEGFLYPVVDKESCIDCGLCEKVCPIINEGTPRDPIKVFAAINTNEEIRMKSSSGGIFTLLAEQVIKEGGVVFGARFDEQWQVQLDYTETIEGIAAFRGSKYVQARTGSTYRQAESFLKQGRKVMFTGTPCQIAGLKKFLRKEYENLLTVDFVCHGVPSPLVWSKYLKERLASLGEKNSVLFSSKFKDVSKRTISLEDISFRNKNLGWKKFSFVLYGKTRRGDSRRRENTVLFSCMHYKDTYMRAFLNNLILRPSCHNCKCKEGKSNADLTIADFWGIDNYNPNMDDDKGTSLILIYTFNGKKCFFKLNLLKTEECIENARKYNPGLESICKPHPNRILFFKEIKRKNSVKKMIDNMLKPSLVRKCILLCERIIK